MSDETELSLDLTSEQSEIEASLESVRLPESAIDEYSVMYQAGWAAAMAEHASPATASKTSSHMWPTLAMTFAATTAACLAVIVFAFDSDRSGDVAVANPTAMEQGLSGDTNVLDHEVTLDEDREDKVRSSSTQSSTSKLLARFMGASSELGFARRNAQLSQFAKEAASPNRIVVSGPIADWETEAAAPLTSGAVRSFPGI